MSSTDMPEINEASAEQTCKEPEVKNVRRLRYRRDYTGLYHEFCKFLDRDQFRQINELNLIANDNYICSFTTYYLSSMMMSNASSAEPCSFERSNREKDTAEIEKLAKKYCLKAFNLDDGVWGCNVQPYSRSLANLAVYLALCKPIEFMMGIDKTNNSSHVLPTHGATPKNPSVSFVFFDGVACNINNDNEEAIYTELEINARLVKPKVITVAASFYPKVIDFERISKIAKTNNAYFFMDMSEISGLVAAGIIPSPFEYSDVVTTATDMTLRGPHAAVIFYRKNVKFDQEIACKLEDRINQAVSRLHSGSNSIMVSIATIMRDIKTFYTKFVQYQLCLLENTKNLGETLRERYYNVILNENMHFVVVDVCQMGINADLAAKVFDAINIGCTTCCVPQDDNSLHGIKFGMAALTTRKNDLSYDDIEAIVDFIDKGFFICRTIFSIVTKTGKNFDDILTSDKEILEEIRDVKTQVENMAKNLPIAYSDLLPMALKYLNENST